ncbi:MAG: ABC transporter substrate-binding protein [Dehalococcoidales bacterium]|nr:ABC transporter substrate-binding protein [Dehalococcoidales bacterium]
MRRKVLWVFLTLLTVMAVILTSCKTETTTTGETEVVKGVVTKQAETPAPEAVKPADTTRTEKPQYGGVVIRALAADILSFDEGVALSHPSVVTLHLTNEELLQFDWTKGPGGTNEADFILGGINDMRLKTGSLADSWQIPERGKIVFHIREGVYWHNKPPTSGRKLTVDDVVFSINRMCTESTSYIKMSYPNLAKTAVITGDETTRMVTIECPVSEWGNSIAMFPDFCTIMPRDAIEKFGNLNDWRNSIGTGPFMLTDFVSNGSATLIRNPNYWETNPIGPGKGDKLPYIDGVKILIIADISTRMAAMRTAKIDWVSGTDFYYDDVKEFLDNPNIKSVMYTSDSSYVIGMRTDMADSPFSKKEVRQALTLATDFNKIKNEFYDGKAVILNWPITYKKEYADAYVPMEKLPANVQELFSYNVAKAKGLLTAAGYPTLKTSIICYNTPTQVDFLSFIQNMWSQVGVTLTIDAKDYATWVSRTRTRNYGASELLYASTSGAWQRMINFNGPGQYNPSYINDPIVAEAATKVLEYIGIDEGKIAQMYVDLMPYVLEQCWVISKPSPYLYTVWWSWIKNWNGELFTGYYNTSYVKYIWTDQALKKQMTGR